MTDADKSNRNKGGRPRVPEPRRHRLSVRLTEAEHKRIDELVSESNMSRSEAARLLFFNVDLPKKVAGGVHVDAAKLYTKLQPLQSNINQIAHRLNEQRPTNLSSDQINKITQLVLAAEKTVKDFRSWVLTAQPNLNH